jgi:hypothetical protein
MARRPAYSITSHSARRDVEGRRAGHLHGAVKAMARWGAAG